MRRIFILMIFATALLASGCGATADKAREMGISAERAERAASDAAEAAAIQEALEAAASAYRARVNASEQAIEQFTRGQRGWSNAIDTCFDVSSYINQFAPCWDGVGSRTSWRQRGNSAISAVDRQVASGATSPTCNRAALVVSRRIGAVLSSWARFDEVLAAQDVDLTNRAKDRVFAAMGKVDASVTRFSDACSAPSDIS